MFSIFDDPEFDHHEQIVFCHDEETGLRAIIAIHDTTLGPAAGGCRMWPYASSVGLHKLKGDRKGQWAMTVNGPWRICFRFQKGDAYDVEIVDYHRG